MLFTSLILALVGSTFALPAQKRQVPPPVESAASGLLPAPSAANAPLPMPSVSGPMPSLSGPMPSLASPEGPASPPMPSGMSPPSPPAGPSSNGTENYLGYPCPTGYELSYAEVQQTYPYSYSTLQSAGLLGNWTSAPQYGGAPAEVSSNANVIGATRSRPAPGLDVVNEVLVNLTSTDGYYQAVSNLTAPITVEMNTISNWSYVYQVYSNDTAPITDGVEPTTVKVFANACAAEQASAVRAMERTFSQSLDNINAILGGTNGPVSGPASPNGPGPANGPESRPSMSMPLPGNGPSMMPEMPSMSAPVAPGNGPQPSAGPVAAPQPSA